MVQSYIGTSLTRKEDVRFLTGRATYTDDFKAQHLLHAAVLRSPHPHARILSIDVSEALEMPGVEGVFTYKDVEASLEPRPIPLRLATLPGIERFLQYPMARDKVRYVGEAVAVVVADSRYTAEDALDAIHVDYEPLPPVVDVRQSLGGESLLNQEHGTNIAAEYTVGFGDVEAAFRDAEYTRREEFRCHRHTGVPMETRGLLASYDPGREELTVWGETKVPHFNRGVLSSLLQMPEHRIHFIEGDVGGGFGITGEFYPEDFIIPFASIKLGRPIKWIEDRREHMVSANHSREHVCELEIAAKRDGTFLALRSKVYGDVGGYVRTHGGLVTSGTAVGLTGPYRIASFDCQFYCMLTNKTGMGTLRAPGSYEAAFFRERLVDMVAQDLNIDPAELRMKNLIPAADMPYRVGVQRPEFPPMEYDSGDFPTGLARTLEAIDYDRVKELQGQLIDGKYHGIGLASFVKSTGAGPPYEGARVRVSEGDQVAVYLGITTMGQGHETSMAQICADGLGVPIEYITVYHGDTDLMPTGGGTYADRGTVLAGSAVLIASQELRQKVLNIAAGYLDVDPVELEFVQGQVRRVGSSIEGPLLDLGQVLELASPTSRYNQGEMGLDVTSYFRLPNTPYAYGNHATHVAIDAETGQMDILRYIVVEDVGTVINPLLATGQAVGSAVQGIGGTVLEDLAYDSSGQPLATTLMDYLLPTATDVPGVETVHLDLAPSPLNPLGAKGAGQGGIVAPGAALGNAVSHALASFGVQVRELPLSPDHLRRLIRG